jgi:hypothetical protein
MITWQVRDLERRAKYLPELFRPVVAGFRVEGFESSAEILRPQIFVALADCVAVAGFSAPGNALQRRD